MDTIRLSKALAAAGIASRRKAEQLIFNGDVQVNGTKVQTPQTLVHPTKDVVIVQGQILNALQSKVYYLLNKPKGYLCSHQRIGSKKIVYDLFSEESKRLFTVGRLDRETTGLLLVTNDGHFANRVIHPSANITKEYLVKTREFITDSHLKIINQGALVEKKWVRPVSIKKVRKGTLKIVVKEGRKREVRTLVEKAGLGILQLHRIRIGPLLLGSIQSGCYRLLTEQEIQLFH